MQVLSQAFGRGKGSQKFERDLARFIAEPESYLVLETHGEVVSALHISRHQIQIGSSVITKADVGEVSTLPKYQGKGYGTRLMEETVRWMQQEGFHLSRLGGYVRFYRRFGWVPFPRGFVEFPLAGLTSRGSHTDPDAFLKTTNHPGQIRPYDPTRDAPSCYRLYGRFNHYRTGAQLQGSTPFPTGDSSLKLDPWRVVYEEAGEVLAYLFARTAPTDHSRFETRVAIQEAGVAPEWPKPLGYLLRHILLGAYHYGARTVSARLPLDPYLYSIYRDYSLGFVPVLWQTTESGNMLQIIDLPALISILIPEFQTRLQNTAIPVQNGGLRFCVNGQTVDLHLQDGIVIQGPGNSPEVEFPQDLFCQLLLGLQPVFHVVRQLPVQLPKESIALLEVLFPPQPTATGVWG
jgi:GNAT superfamily N-acetyltransferase